MKLNDLKVKGIKPGAKPVRFSDGHGLYLEVTPAGSKLWKMAYRFDQKQKTLSFGKYPFITLARAREKCRDAKTLLADGIDPLAKAKEEQIVQRAKTEDTFSKIAAELLEKRRLEGLSETTLQKKQWFIRLANEDLGDCAIRDLTAADILVPLRRQEDRECYETARRLRSTIGQVFRYAVATARADTDPTFALRDALITPKVRHMAAATRQEDFAEVIQTIWSYQGGAALTRAALKLMALLYTRPGELRLSYWDEFDLKAKTWTIPAERMKMRRAHKKPLSKPVLDILSEIRELTGSESRVFPSLTGRDRPISENTMNQALRRMSFSRVFPP